MIKSGSDKRDRQTMLKQWIQKRLDYQYPERVEEQNRTTKY